MFQVPAGLLHILLLFALGRVSSAVSHVSSELAQKTG